MLNNTVIKNVTKIRKSAMNVRCMGPDWVDRRYRIMDKTINIKKENKEWRINMLNNKEYEIIWF